MRLWKRRSAAQKPREGIFNLAVTRGGSAGYNAQIRVLEVGRQGTLSRVRVLLVTGVPRWHRPEVAGLVKEWMPTSGITWLEERR